MSESNAEQGEFPGGPIIIAMKGPGCSGKSMLARELATSLRHQGYKCSLLRHDDIRDSIRKTFGLSARDLGLHDHLTYQMLWQIASTDLAAGIRIEKTHPAIILDSSLQLPCHLKQVLSLADIFNPIYNGELFFVVIECRPTDKLTWRKWSESRLPATDELSSWEVIQKEILDLEDYCMDGVDLQYTVDTTDSTKSTQDHATYLIGQISSHHKNFVKDISCLSIRDDGLSQEVCWGDISHHHPLFLYPQGLDRPHDYKVICALCQETLYGSIYGCSQCDFYLHKWCAELPPLIKFGRGDFILELTNKEEIAKSSACIVCQSSSGVLYSSNKLAVIFDRILHIHSKCAQLPRKLKHSCHEHDLKLKITHITFTCAACGTYGHVAGYHCKVCRIYFHIMCTVYLESSVLHNRHQHNLVLCTIPRDDTDEYYCEICAGERHPDLWVYHCKPCEYEAHVSCVNPLIKPCNPDVLLPEYKAEGEFTRLWRFNKSFPDLSNPILPQISGRRLAWESVGNEEDPDSDPDYKSPPREPNFANCRRKIKEIGWKYL